MDTGQLWRAAHNAHIVELLDRMIGDWTERRKTAAGAADFLVADCHVNALQLVRETLAGEPLSLPEIDILEKPHGFTVMAAGGRALTTQWLGNETTNLERAEAFLKRLAQSTEQRKRPKSCGGDSEPIPHATHRRRGSARPAAERVRREANPETLNPATGEWEPKV